MNGVNSQWNEEENRLSRIFRFNDFKEALAFVNRVGELAEKVNHHPDIFLHEYKHVRLSLTTHSAGVVTKKDRMLADEIDAVLNS